MSEEEKKRLKEYQKNFREARKSQYDNCDIIIKQFFNCDLIKYATQLYIIKSLYLLNFRQTDRNKSLTIHDQHILLGFIVLKNLFVIITI